MSNSLSDQLLKAGLIDKKKADKAQKAKHKARVQQTKNKKKRDRGPQESELDRKIQAEQAAKVARDRELNASQKADQQNKELAAQARQIIETHQVPLPDAEDELVDYNFADDKTVRKLLVTEEQGRQLGRGSLAIARLDDGYALIPGSIADRVSARYADAIVVRHEVDESADDDDPYAAYEVPDDLMW